MVASVTRPLPFGVVIADQVAAAPASNTNDNRHGKVWRAASASSYVVIDLGDNASYDMVALIGTNLTAGDTVRVRTGPTNTGTGSWDQTVAAMTGSKPLGFTTKTIVSLATRTDRYMRIDITAASAVEVQRIVVGPSITTIGIDYDAEQSTLDTAVVNTELGADTYQRGLKKIRWKFSMSMVPTTEWRSTWLGFLNEVGKITPVLFVPFVDQPDTYQADAIFGRIRNDISGKIPGLQYRAVEMTVEGISI